MILTNQLLIALHSIFIMQAKNPQKNIKTKHKIKHVIITLTKKTFKYLNFMRKFEALTYKNYSWSFQVKVIWVSFYRKQRFKFLMVLATWSKRFLGYSLNIDPRVFLEPSSQDWASYLWAEHNVSGSSLSEIIVGYVEYSTVSAGIFPPFWLCRQCFPIKDFMHSLSLPVAIFSSSWNLMWLIAWCREKNMFSLWIECFLLFLFWFFSFVLLVFLLHIVVKPINLAN